MQHFTDILSAVIFVVFVATVIAAMVYDTWKYQIPNFVSILLVALFALAALLLPVPINWLLHVGIGAAVFVVGAVLFSFGLFGGGDVKMLAALSLWMGLGLLADFLLLVGVIGGVLGLLLIVLRRYAGPVEKAWTRTGIRFPAALAAGKNVPYGLAIGAAALIVCPRIALLPWPWNGI